VGTSSGHPPPDRLSLVSQWHASRTGGARERSIRADRAGLSPRLSRDGLGLYARVSSHDQRADLDRQVARLCEWAAKTGLPVARVESEVGSGMNGARAKVRRLLADPK